MDSDFDLGNVLCDSLTFNLKGKSIFRTTSDSFTHFFREKIWVTEKPPQEKFPEKVERID
ncbi:conserved hypothetical protein [Capnocytophaga canimorsus]|uniref:Uncharacterized protein n=1 Tax=Capnocytophaga canimorsus TaxID=28188 RepID=A0A0B7HV77_9FLAO|nr:hypothetical protein [Capnocytophaga canimorsus]CEN41423.1 conserved hypothetical protein [Capnocytophaga canimorsus]